jgi:hypothetical protein
MALAMLLNLVVAAMAGIFIPLAMERFGRDPAVGLERVPHVHHRQHGLPDLPRAGDDSSCSEHVAVLLRPVADRRPRPRSTRVSVALAGIVRRAGDSRRERST